LYSPQWPPR